MKLTFGLALDGFRHAPAIPVAKYPAPNHPVILDGAAHAVFAGGGAK